MDSDVIELLELNATALNSAEARLKANEQQLASYRSQISRVAPALKQAGLLTNEQEAVDRITRALQKPENALTLLLNVAERHAEKVAAAGAGPTPLGKVASDLGQSSTTDRDPELAQWAAGTADLRQLSHR